MANKELKQPKQLLLLRHAKSDWDSGASNDFGRPLSARGKRDAPQMGRWLAENGYPPDRIIASPSARTTETVELVCAGLALEEGRGGMLDNVNVVYDRRLYHGAPDHIRALAAENLQDFDRVLLVAHNPGMELALLAYCPAAEPFADGKLMPTCALAVLEFDGPADAGTANLRALMRPSEIQGK